MIKAKTVYGLFNNHPDRWIKGNMARISKRSRRAVLPNSPLAGAFCLLGALHRVYPKSRKEAERKVIKAIWEIFPKKSGFITVFNDNSTTKFSDILKVVRKAKV